MFFTDMLTYSSVSLLSLALLLGIRHGIDWDHIAAITDITGTTERKREGLFLGFIYAIGHASVILILGLFAVLIGLQLPPTLDWIMSKIVGITLLFLGGYLLFSIIKHGSQFRIRSRWMILFRLLDRAYHQISHRLGFAHKHEETYFHYPEKYGFKTSFFVGMIHGIGAETPTQVLLFVSAAGAGHSWESIFLVLLFVLGLIASNTLINLLSVYGYVKARQNSRLYLAFGLLTAIFSFIVGLLFLFNQSRILPVIFGG